MKWRPRIARAPSLNLETGLLPTATATAKRRGSDSCTQPLARDVLSALLPKHEGPEMILAP